MKCGRRRAIGKGQWSKAREVYCRGCDWRKVNAGGRLRKTPGGGKDNKRTQISKTHLLIGRSTNNGADTVRVNGEGSHKIKVRQGDILAWTVGETTSYYT